MKILAVSDIRSKGLEHIVESHPKKLQKLDLVISCGDLPKDYLELLAEGLHKNLIFVCGNHHFRVNADDYFENTDLWEDNKICYISGNYDLHGRIEEYKGYLIVGFGGSHWYSGRGNELKEKEMAKVVKKVLKQIDLYKKSNKNHSAKVIVVSHAPLFLVHDKNDPCHIGFKCFHDFLKAVSPILWIHGHVHLEDLHNNQVTVIESTTIINAFCYKYINIEPKEIKISYSPGILDT